MLKVSNYVISVPIMDNQTNQPKAVIYSTRSNVLKSIDMALWQHLIQGKYEGIPKNILDELTHDIILVDEGEDERQIVLKENKAANTDSTQLYMSIQPTAACPLGCGYCGQKHENKNMKQDVQDELIERIEKKLSTHSYKSLFITWFGAEPLSGYGAIKKLTPRILGLVAKYSIAYDSKIVTNGLLLNPDLAEEILYTHKVRNFEITLDGDNIYHDQRRHTKAGGPTFDTIYKHLKALAKLPEAKITIRANVDNRNRDGVRPLLERLKADNLQQRLNFYVAPIHSWGNDAHLMSAEKLQFAQWDIEWLIELQELGFNVGFLPKRNKSLCMTVQPHNELVDPFGDVFSCTEVSLVPSYLKDGKNKHRLGDLKDTAIVHPNGPWNSFYEDQTLSKYDCWTCPMLPTCGGACPKEWSEGRIPCPPTKFNIKERMLLAVVRSQNHQQNLSI